MNFVRKIITGCSIIICGLFLFQPLFSINLACPSLFEEYRDFLEAEKTNLSQPAEKFEIDNEIHALNNLRRLFDCNDTSQEKSTKLLGCLNKKLASFAYMLKDKASPSVCGQVMLLNLIAGKTNQQTPEVIGELRNFIKNNLLKQQQQEQGEGNANKIANYLNHLIDKSFPAINAQTIELFKNDHFGQWIQLQSTIEEQGALENQNEPSWGANFISGCIPYANVLYATPKLTAMLFSATTLATWGGSALAFALGSGTMLLSNWLANKIAPTPDHSESAGLACYQKNITQKIESLIVITNKTLKIIDEICQTSQDPYLISWAQQIKYIEGIDASWKTVNEIVEALKPIGFFEACYTLAEEPALYSVKINTSNPDSSAIKETIQTLWSLNTLADVHPTQWLSTDSNKIGITIASDKKTDQATCLHFLTNLQLARTIGHICMMKGTIGNKRYVVENPNASTDVFDKISTLPENLAEMLTIVTICHYNSNQRKEVFNSLKLEL